MEVEAPSSGTLHCITARSGEKVAVGTVVAWIYAVGEEVLAGKSVEAAPEVLPEITLGRAASIDPTPEDAPAPAAEFVVTAPPEVNFDEALLPRATPAARLAARGAGVALHDVPGSRPLGRVQGDDIAAFLEAKVPITSPSIWTLEPGKLNISRRNGQGVPIMLIHGFTADSQSWAPFEKALGPKRPLIRIDLPGRGKSPKRRVTNFAELARMMVEAFDDATHDVDAVHLVGHSLGGALAIALADIRNRKVTSLSLIAPAGLGPEIDADALAGIVCASRAESLAPWLRRLTATPDGISDEYARAAMAARKDPSLRAAQAEMTAALFPDGVQAFDLRAAVARLDCSTQMLRGRQDQILPYRQALAASGDFAIHLLKDAGHVPQIECPDRVARIVQRLIMGVDATV